MPSPLEQFRRFNSHDAHPALQFVKYGIAGGIASGVNLAVFYACAWFLFPALTQDDPFVQGLGLLGIEVATPAMSDAVRSNRTMAGMAVAFVFSNLVAYLLNIAWVFRGGRHNRSLEVLLFFGSSGLSTLVGTVLAGALVRWTGLATTYAFVCNVVAAVSINYAARKYWIFKG